jgi:hypothetical protein
LCSKLPLDVIEDAQIEIVAPVLSAGDAKWKGIYNDLPISFEMNDQVFKQAVLGKQISFKNGDMIVCVLEIHREVSTIIGEFPDTQARPKAYICIQPQDHHFLLV